MVCTRITIYIYRTHTSKLDVGGNFVQVGQANFKGES